MASESGCISPNGTSMRTSTSRWTMIMRTFTTTIINTLIQRTIRQ